MPLLFGLVNPRLDSDATLLLLVTLASAVGSFVHIATSFANHVGRNRFETSWVVWYALRCPIGAALATVFYFVVRAGFFSGDAPNSAVNAYGIAAVAGFVGLFSRQATDKLRELFDTLFKTDGAEEEVDPVLGSVTPNPVAVDGDPVRLTLTGACFVRLSRCASTAAPFRRRPSARRRSPSSARGRSPREAVRRGLRVNPGPNSSSDPVVVTVAGAPAEMDDHYWLVASRMLAGRVVPFLGAGANLCGRPGRTAVGGCGGGSCPAAGARGGTSPSGAAIPRSPRRTCCGSPSTWTRCSGSGRSTNTCAPRSTPTTRRRAAPLLADLPWAARARCRRRCWS